MKKLIIAVIISLTLLCGCSQNDTRSDVVINHPLDDTVNGYKKENALPTYSTTDEMPDKISGEDVAVGSISQAEASQQNEISKQYCGNKNSKVFHSADCGSLKNTKEENKVYLSNRSQYIAEGYKPCGRCNP